MKLPDGVTLYIGGRVLSGYIPNKFSGFVPADVLKRIPEREKELESAPANESDTVKLKEDTAGPKKGKSESSRTGRA